MSARTTHEFLLYFLASACSLAVDLILLRTLVISSQMHYLPAACISFLAGALTSYVLCIRLVFKSRRLEDPLPEFSIFAGVGLFGLGLNALAMMIGIELLGLGLLLSKICSAGLTFLTNFVLRKFLLFTKPQYTG